MNVDKRGISDTMTYSCTAPSRPTAGLNSGKENSLSKGVVSYWWLLLSSEKKLFFLRKSIIGHPLYYG
jgi:hypothetical protein